MKENVHHVIQIIAFTSIAIHHCSKHYCKFQKTFFFKGFAFNNPEYRLTQFLSRPHGHLIKAGKSGDYCILRKGIPLSFGARRHRTEAVRRDTVANVETEAHWLSAGAVHHLTPVNVVAVRRLPTVKHHKPAAHHHLHLQANHQRREELVVVNGDARANIGTIGEKIPAVGYDSADGVPFNEPRCR